MNPTILILSALAAAAVLAGVAYTVMGKGGQLARFEADHPPLDLPEGRRLGPADLAGVALPVALWGYHVRGVDELLRRITAALEARDQRIAELEARLAGAEASTGPKVLYPRTPPSGVPFGPGQRVAGGAGGSSAAGGGAEPSEPSEPADPSETSAAPSASPARGTGSG
ncbi:hypothetical protein [Nocardiopsis coralliicola]